jgi:hypothetical protein
MKQCRSGTYRPALDISTGSTYPGKLGVFIYLLILGGGESWGVGFLLLPMCSYEVLTMSLSSSQWVPNKQWKWITILSIYHLHVSCSIPAKNQSWTQYEDQAKRVQKSDARPTTLAHIKVESFQTREMRGKWVLAKWVEKVELAFGGKLWRSSTCSYLPNSLLHIPLLGGAV